MYMQVYGYASLISMGRRSPRRFHIIQKCLGAWRHATPPLGVFALPSGNRAHPPIQRLFA
eukprot:2337766-Pyramimonas_sp.AAC.1